MWNSKSNFMCFDYRLKSWTLTTWHLWKFSSACFRVLKIVSAKMMPIPVVSISWNIYPKFYQIFFLCNCFLPQRASRKPSASRTLPSQQWPIPHLLSRSLSILPPHLPTQMQSWRVLPCPLKTLPLRPPFQPLSQLLSTPHKRFLSSNWLDHSRHLPKHQTTSTPSTTHPRSSIQIVPSRPVLYHHPFLLLFQWPLCWPAQQQALLQCL